MISVRVDEVFDSTRQGDIQVESEDFKEWVDLLQNQDQQL